MNAWIGVDLDGTLAFHDPDVPFSFERIGEPVPAMMQRVRAWLAEGKDVKIFTARVSDAYTAPLARQAIAKWLFANDLPNLEITCRKDYGMVELWDDRAVRVERNTGQVAYTATKSC